MALPLSMPEERGMLQRLLTAQGEAHVTTSRRLTESMAACIQVREKIFAEGAAIKDKMFV